MTDIEVNSSTPLVSISCITFNHELFIREAIEGFLMQKTTFPFEILIHDDASTDGTIEIIREYEKRFPDLIFTIFQRENQFSKGEKPGVINRDRARGKYIALCEGDDYWTDPFKLQKQIDFMELNPDFAICHHNMLVIYEENSKEAHLSNKADQKEVTTIDDLVHGNYIYTASCLYRNELMKELPEWYKKCPIGDYPLHMLNAQFGKIKYMPEVMGTYRVHKNGIWENKDADYRIEKWVDLIDQMKNHFTPKINKSLQETQIKDIEYLLINFKNDHEKCRHYSIKLLENEPTYLANLRSEYVTHKDELELVKGQLLQTKEEINQLIASGSWRITKPLRMAIKFLRSISANLLF